MYSFYCEPESASCCSSQADLLAALSVAQRCHDPQPRCLEAVASLPLFNSSLRNATDALDAQLHRLCAMQSVPLQCVASKRQMDSPTASDGPSSCSKAGSGVWRALRRRGSSRGVAAGQAPVSLTAAAAQLALLMLPTRTESTLDNLLFL